MTTQTDRPAALRSAARADVAPAGAGRPASLIALCAAMLVAALLVLPAPAQAHDTLLGSDPADGSTVETSPEEIVFTFSSDILDVSPLVRISDESGAEIAEIVPAVDGPTATAELPEPLSAGTYEIQWRVVSGDGHPIEGTQTLTVEQDPAEEETAAPSDAGGAAPSDAGGAQEPVAGTEQPAAESPSEAGEDAESGNGLPMPVLLGILAVIVVGVGIAGIAILRRRD